MRNASVARKGSTPVESSDPSLIFNVLLEQLHLGGETVRQGEEVLRYRLGDLLPYLRGEDAERTYSLRIVGSSDHEGRPVVVARAEGYIWAADEPMSIDGTHYFDIETGVALYTNTQLHHVSGSDTNSRVRFVRNLELRPPRTAQAGSGEAKGLAWGECVNEI